MYVRTHTIWAIQGHTCALDTDVHDCGLHGFEHLAMIMSLNLGNNNDTAGQGKTWHLFMFVLSVWIYTHNFFTFKIRNALCCEGYEEQYFSWYWNPKAVCKVKGQQGHVSHVDHDLFCLILHRGGKFGTKKFTGFLLLPLLQLFMFCDEYCRWEPLSKVCCNFSMLTNTLSGIFTFKQDFAYLLIWQKW